MSKSETIGIICLLVVGIFLSATTLVSDNASAKYWSIETVDSGNGIGYWPSLAVDNNDYPHISYYDENNKDLKYAKWTGGSWSIETVDSYNDVGTCTSIALDSNGFPHISYLNSTSGHLKYAKWTGSSWSIETVDIGVGGYTSLTLDSSDYAHISYYDGTNDALKYAGWNGSAWNITTVDGVGNHVGWYTSIALDSNEYPHISYHSDSALKYARWTGTAWNKESLDSAGACTSIALDSSDHAHISYLDSTLGDLKYAKNTSSGWSKETVDSTGFSGLHTSIELDGNGYPHISYVEDSWSDLKYAWWNGSGWNIDTVDSASGVQRTSLALDSNGYAHISYQDLYGGELKYVKELSGIPPSAPQNLTSTTGDGFVNLTWEPPLDGGGFPITSYNIYRNGTTGVYESVPGTQLWYNDTKVFNGMGYSYNVSAVNSKGEGPKSIALNVTPMTVPSEPENLTAGPEDGLVTLTWEPPSSDGGSAIDHYKVYRRTESHDWIYLWGSGANETKVMETNVTNGKTYYYKVSAVNGVGEGPNSTEVNATPNSVNSDDDSLPDAWELEYFGDLSYGDSDDPDGDGYTNLEEYQHGTDPTDENDYPAEDENEDSTPFIVTAIKWIFIILISGIIISVIMIFLRRKPPKESTSIPEPIPQECVEIETSSTSKEAADKGPPKV